VISAPRQLARAVRVDVVAQARDGSELVGLEAAGRIRDEFPEIGILVLSAHIEVEHAMELLASGSRSGYLLKSRVTDVNEFLETVERIARGGSVVDPALVQELVAARRTTDSLADLTAREREVLSLSGDRGRPPPRARGDQVPRERVTSHAAAFFSWFSPKRYGVAFAIERWGASGSGDPSAAFSA
jgi:hypothetical protein